MAAADVDPVIVDWSRTAAGEVAVDVAVELTAPLNELRDRLAMLVDRIDRHVATSTGPEAYPFRQLQSLRQDLATAYLETTQLARLAADLQATIGGLGAGIVEIAEVEHQVEAAVQLARPRLGAHTELLLDLGRVPAVRAPAAELVLAIARMIFVCGASASGVEKAALSVRARAEEEGGRTWVVITASDNGAGAPTRAEQLVTELTPFARELGGTFEGTSPEGQGSAFELRIPSSS